MRNSRSHRWPKYIESLLWLKTAAPSAGITQLTDNVIAGPGTGVQVATVLKIHDATVPIAGALVTGNALQVTGPSALGYGPINLAGGPTFVTGALPDGNQAPQTLAGDVDGTTATAHVKGFDTRPLTLVAPTPGQAYVWDGTHWTPTTVSSVNGVKNILAAPTSAGGSIPGDDTPTTVQSVNVVAAAGQTFVVLAAPELIDVSVEGVFTTGVFVITIEVAVDGVNVTGMDWTFEWTNPATGWSDMKWLPARLVVGTNISAGAHAIEVVVTSNFDILWTSASQLIVEQLIPSG